MTLCKETSQKRFLLFFALCFILIFNDTQTSPQNDQNDEEIPTVNVELDVVCDMEFSKAFGYDDTTILDFWVHHIEDLNMNFQTLRKSNVLFNLTHVRVIKNVDEQPFLENFKFLNETFQLTNLTNEFATWVYKNRKEFQGDVALLVTGHQLTPTLSIKLSACSDELENKGLHPVLVLHSGNKNWHTPQQLAAEMAELLGATNPENTTCTGVGSILEQNLTSSNKYFFSDCTDQLINEFIMSESAWCLRTSNSDQNLLTNFSRAKYPPNLTEQCRTYFNNSEAFANLTEATCQVTDCLLNTSSEIIVLGKIYPIYNTPCATDKFCFRGRCLPTGLMIKNVQKEMCLLSNDRFARNDNPAVAECPKFPTKLDQFMIYENEGYALQLRMVYTNIYSKDKCLTLDSDGVYLVFASCPAKFFIRFGWDIVPINNYTDEFYLCHRESRKCAYINYYDEATIAPSMEILFKQLSSTFRFHGDSNISVVLSKYITKGEENISFCEYYYNESAKSQCCQEGRSIQECWRKQAVMEESSTNDMTTSVSTYEEISTTLPSTSSEETSSKNDEDDKIIQNLWWIGFMIAGLIAFLVIIVAGIYCVKFFCKPKQHIDSSDQYFFDKFYNGDTKTINPMLGVASQADLLPFDKHWEFPKSRLKLGTNLGSGAFGLVVQATAYEILENERETIVAVKMVNVGAEITYLRSLMSELKIMSHLGDHLNIVNLLGACTKSLRKSKQLYVILEYCKYGCIRSYLHRHRNNFAGEKNSNVPTVWVNPEHKNLSSRTNQSVIDIPKPTNATINRSNLSRRLQQNTMEPNSIPLTKLGNVYTTDPVVDISNEIYDDTELKTVSTTDLIYWSFQIANGMEYLASRRVLHGDLAARNCLLAENNIVKICDFGFSKTLNKNYDYNYQKDCQGALLPFKWMALESMTGGVFSSETDCWSYGVVLWEIFTLGDTPYSGFNVDFHFIEYIQNGNRLPMPRYAPQSIYDLMLMCWSEDPKKRPKFFNIVEILKNMLNSDIHDIYTKMKHNYKNTSKYFTKSDILLKMGKFEHHKWGDTGLHYIFSGENIKQFDLETEMKPSSINIQPSPRLTSFAKSKATSGTLPSEKVNKDVQFGEHEVEIYA